MATATVAPENEGMFTRFFAKVKRLAKRAARGVANLFRKGGSLAKRAAKAVWRGTKWVGKGAAKVVDFFLSVVIIALLFVFVFVLGIAAVLMFILDAARATLRWVAEGRPYPYRELFVLDEEEDEEDEEEPSKGTYENHPETNSDDVYQTIGDDILAPLDMSNFPQIDSPHDVAWEDYLYQRDVALAYKFFADKAATSHDRNDYSYWMGRKYTRETNMDRRKSEKETVSLFLSAHDRRNFNVRDVKFGIRDELECLRIVAEREAVHAQERIALNKRLTEEKAKREAAAK